MKSEEEKQFYELVNASDELPEKADTYFAIDGDRKKVYTLGDLRNIASFSDRLKWLKLISKEDTDPGSELGILRQYDVNNMASKRGYEHRIAILEKENAELKSSLTPKSIIEDAEKIKEDGVITYKVMLRQSSTRRDGKGNVIIPESELLEWFGRGLHLQKYTSWDTI